MLRTLSFSELSHESLRAESLEAYRQIWKQENRWLGYEKIPRPTNGLLFFCSELEARFLLRDGSTLSAQKGDVVFIPKGTLYTVEFTNGGTDPDLFTVNFDLYDSNGNSILLNDLVTSYSGAARQACLDAANELSEAYLFSGSLLKRQALFFRLLDALSEHFERYSAHYYPIRRGVTAFRREWNRNERIERYAKLCDLSESSFYFFFKRWCGLSPIDYRNELRLNAARSLLLHSTLSIQEIAAHVGFDDPYYFSRLFKKKCGVSPREFRRSQN